MNKKQTDRSRNVFHFLNIWWNQRATNNNILGNQNRWLPSPGNIIFTLVIAGLLILTQRAWANNSQSANTPGPSATTINYQGRLADDAGNPQTSMLGMSFAIWDAANGGGIIWGPESHAAVPVTDGLFNVGLGSQTSGGIPTTVWNGDRYLEITVSGETLTPRELIRSVPIAGMALTVPDGAITSQKLSRTLHELTLQTPVQMPSSHTDYQILSKSLDLEHDTLITIHVFTAMQNNNEDTLFGTKLIIGGIQIAGVHNYGKQGIGEQLGFSTSFMLSSGQHDIELVGSSWANDGYVNEGIRTQMIIVEG